MTNVPNVSTFTTAPLRNRVRVELKAPVSEVWALIGDLAKLPELSAGLERVDAKVDSSGQCTEFVCHFKPLAEGAKGIVSREVVRWWEAGRGYASSSAEGDAFGMTNDLNLVVIEPARDGAIVTFEEYFEARDLDMMKAHFDEALAGIGENLARRLGGTVIERYVET